MVADGLPSGTVTFLFTDVVDSTPLWEARTKEMRAAIADLDALASAIVSAHGGTIIKSMGDGAMAAFQDADAALDAAIEIQRSVTARDWALTVAVRAGLHTGHATPVDGDYHEPAVNRAARVAGAAHGGQVLLSATTAALVDSARTIDLGEHELKGLPRQALHQAVADGLQASFPPSPTRAMQSGAPPRSASTFVGRERDLDQVAALLAANRLVTLTGAGGSGKTRLAIEVLQHHQDRVAFVDLAPASTDVEVVVTVANALGLSGRVTDDLAERVCEHLASQRLVCALDNCEHVIDVVADLADDVLRRAGDSRLLVTSREPIGVAGEQVCAVAPLPVDTDAVQLFIDRAREVRPDFDFDEPTRHAVHEICLRLDGLPLAIELAAARIAHLSPTQLLERLDDRFRVLTGGRRRVPRHQTLATTLDWSHDLLEPQEQVMLRHLSTFPSTFTLEAAEVLGGVDGPIDVLGSLVAKSLVQDVPQPDGSLRYRLLETVRMYAGERLAAAGEAPELHRAHRDLVVEWFDAIPLEGRWFSDHDHFAEERAGVRAALQWSADESDLVPLALLAGGVDWTRSADWHDGRRWCDLGIAHGDELPPTLRRRLLVNRLVLSQVASEVGELGRAQAIYDSVPSDEPMLQAITRSWCALQRSLDLDGGPGDVQVKEDVHRFVDEAVEISQEAPPGCRMYTRLLAGYAYLGTGAFESVLDERGEQHLRAGLADGAGLEEHEGLRGGLREYLAVHALVKGQPAEALHLVDGGPTTVIVPMLGNRPGTVQARALAALGRHDDAKKVLREAYETMRTTDIVGGNEIVTLTAVRLALLLEDWEQAARLLGAGRARANRTPDTAFFFLQDRAALRAVLPPHRRRALSDEGIALGSERALADFLA